MMMISQSSRAQAGWRKNMHVTRAFDAFTEKRRWSDWDLYVKISDDTIPYPLAANDMRVFIHGITLLVRLASLYYNF